MSNFDLATSQPGYHRDHHQGRDDASNGNVESMLSSDLQDWLQLTQWHDVEFREKELSNYRQKDEHKPDVVGNHRTYDKPAKEDELALATIAEASKGPKTSFAVPIRENAGSRRPRARSTSPVDSHRNKHTNYRVRDYPESRSMGHNQRRVDGGLPAGHRRRLTEISAYATASPSGSDHHGPNGGQEDARDLARERIARRRPKSFEVGDRGTVRFFVMRSGSWNNLYNSMEDGIWATNVTKADMLGEALSQGITVVLFFAVNHSHGFQGYAVMKSAPSKDVYHPNWWYNVKWKISEPFEVEWIVMEHVETTRVSHILNGLNYDLPVTRSANGQELSYSAGLQMVTVINGYARDTFARTGRVR
ncbi:YTH-domain-containing protein [Annulohypoxylon truncatum]|uniref:YTH-domain-containing protein n=1 Tax=Annulohypoxylon truncatum TaxID=327061 RepID=UPI002008571D|nr:YTH-domain-containing protein [Annulohypoxylon truncatum]KAI1211198.1 YTH-domain-containing protein [Annulohypoxylon truncatum]